MRLMTDLSSSFASSATENNHSHVITKVADDGMPVCRTTAQPKTLHGTIPQYPNIRERLSCSRDRQFDHTNLIIRYHINDVFVAIDINNQYQDT